MENAKKTTSKTKTTKKKENEDSTEKKIEILTIRVNKLLNVSRYPQFVRFQCSICSETSKKRKKEDGKSELREFVGYLPCYSPAFEYKVVAETWHPDPDHPQKKLSKITKRLSWKRLRWWITKDFIKEELEGVWSAKNVEMISTLFKNVISCENDLNEALKSNNLEAKLFQRHFWPDVWFDISVLEHSTDPSKNLYSPRILEGVSSSIFLWDAILSEDLIKALFIFPLSLHSFNYNVLKVLIKKEKERFDNGILSEEDVDFEKFYVGLREYQANITSMNGKPISKPLIYPKVNNNRYQGLTDDIITAYGLFCDIRSNLKYSGDSVFQFKVSRAGVREFIEQTKVLYEVEQNHWTISKHIRNASIVNSVLTHYYYKPEDLKHPSSLEEALNNRICIINTKGHNAFEIFRRLVDKEIESSIRFVCPNMETAKMFFSETDRMPFPLDSGISRPTTLIFCFANQFSLRQLATPIEKYVNGEKEFWPQRIIFFGDPNMTGSKGVGRPFVELDSLGIIPVYNLSWFSPDSQLPCVKEIEKFLNCLEKTKKSSSLPWSSEVQLCDPEKLPLMYKELLIKNNNNPMSYHILCSTYSDLHTAEKICRFSPPNGFTVHEKVLIKETRLIDWIKYAHPFVSPRTSIKDKPTNVCLRNKPFHVVFLNNDNNVKHESDCCGKNSGGYFSIFNHSEHMDWANIQTLRENKIPIWDHVVFIVSEQTTKNQIYTAACMSKKKFTIVGSMNLIDNALKENRTNKTSNSLLRFTMEEKNRVLYSI